jgi:hypothetical protein
VTAARALERDCRALSYRAQLLEDWWPSVLPLGGGYVGGGRAQDERAVQVAADDLESDRQAVVGEAGGDGGCRLAGEVERLGEVQPLERVDLAPVDHGRP